MNVDLSSVLALSPDSELQRIAVSGDLTALSSVAVAAYYQLAVYRLLQHLVFYFACWCTQERGIPKLCVVTNCLKDYCFTLQSSYLYHTDYSTLQLRVP